jgi:hypothetical protein
MYVLDVEYLPITTPALIGLADRVRNLALISLHTASEYVTSANRSEASHKWETFIFLISLWYLWELGTSYRNSCFPTIKPYNTLYDNSTPRKRLRWQRNDYNTLQQEEQRRIPMCPPPLKTLSSLPPGLEDSKGGRTNRESGPLWTCAVSKEWSRYSGEGVRRYFLL